MQASARQCAASTSGQALPSRIAPRLPSSGCRGRNLPIARGSFDYDVQVDDPVRGRAPDAPPGGRSAWGAGGPPPPPPPPPPIQNRFSVTGTKRDALILLLGAGLGALGAVFAGDSLVDREVQRLAEDPAYMEMVESRLLLDSASAGLKLEDLLGELDDLVNKDDAEAAAEDK